MHTNHSQTNSHLNAYKNAYKDPFKNFLRTVLFRDPRDLAVIVVYGIFVSLCSLIVPIAVQTFVNTIGFGLLWQPIVILAAIVLFVLSFSGVVNLLQIYVLEILQQRWFGEIALQFAYRIPRIQPALLVRHPYSDLLTRFFDVITIQKTLAVLVLDGIAVSLQIFFGMVLLAFYHPYLLIFDLLIIAFIFTVFFGLKRSALETSHQESVAKYSVSSWLGELIRNPLTFKSIGARIFAAKQADERATDYVQSRKLHFQVLLKQIGGALLLQVLISSLLLGLGGWLVLQRQLTLGQLVAAELVLSAVVAGIGKFGKYLENYYDLHSAVEKIAYVIDLPLEREDGERLTRSAQSHSPTVSLINVSFTNVSCKDEHGNSILSPLTFTLQHGSKTAITGGIGTGKSTIAELLYGLKDPTSGSIEINGLNLKYGSLEELRSEFYLISGLELIDATILENLRIFRPEATIVEIQELLTALDLRQAIERFPGGLQTQIHHGRLPLSTGQAFKLMIARTLLAQPQILILDDVIDHLDPDSIQALFHLFTTHYKNTTVVLTTRRNVCEELNELCDQVIALEEARVV